MPGPNALAAISLLLTLLVLSFAANATRAEARAPEKEWTIVPDGPPTAPMGQTSNVHIGGLSGLVGISLKDAWTVGYYMDTSTGVNYPAAEHWNGEYWSYVSTPVSWDDNSGFSDVTALSSRDVWAVGGYYLGTDSRSRTLAEHWDGSAWTQAPTETPNGSSADLFGVDGRSSRDVWAVGEYFFAGEATRTLIEHWNGKQWRIVPSPSIKPGAVSNRLHSVVAVSASDVWTVGYALDRTEGTIRVLVEHWDGSTWKIVPAPTPRGGGLVDVDAVSATDIWAVGAYTEGGAGKVFAEHWDGIRWRVVAVPSPGDELNYLEGVTAISGSQVWVVGAYFDSSSHGAKTLTERWDGRQWRVVPSPNPPVVSNGGSVLLSVAPIPRGGGIWAVGGFYNPQAPSEALIERYGVPYCSDGIDNDHDGQADYPKDPGCASKDDGSEIGPYQCDDGADNDGDGKIDYRVNGTGDPECTSPKDGSELLPVGIPPAWSASGAAASGLHARPPNAFVRPRFAGDLSQPVGSSPPPSA